jgi:ribose transport system substrate-binding protein
MKKIVSLLVALCLILGIAACGQTGSGATSPSQSATTAPAATTPAAGGEQKEIKVLFLASSIAIEYFTNAYNSMQPIFAAKGISLDLQGPTKPDMIEEQLAMFENAVSSGEYDLILLYPAVPKAFVDAVRASEKAGVPVIAYAMAPELDCGTYYAGPDNREQGRNIGQAMLDFVESKSDHFGSMESIPVVMWISAASEEINKRAAGIKEVLATDSRFNIVMEQGAAGTEAGMAFGETALIAYPEAELYIGVQDSAGVGVMNALKAAGKVSDTMGVFSADATGAVLAAIKSGELYRATVGTPFSVESPALADFIIQVANGEVEPGYWCRFPLVTMTSANVDEYLN